VYKRQAVVAAGLIGLCLWRLWCWRRHRRITDLFAVLGGGIIVHILAVAGVVAGASAIHISGRLADQIHKLPGRPAAIGLVGYHEPSAVFHLGRDVFLLEASEAALFWLMQQTGWLWLNRPHKRHFWKQQQSWIWSLSSKAGSADLPWPEGGMLT